jgi:hypothetical protein
LDLEVDEDVAKINAIVVGAFGCIAAIRKFPGWNVTPEQGLLISQPLYEMGKKYPKLTSTVLEASAPVSLVIATTAIVSSRVAADKMYHDMLLAQQREAARTAAPPTPQTTHVGAQTVNAPPQPDGANTSGFPKDIDGMARMWANGEAVEV